MPDKRPPKYANELAKYILDVTTGSRQDRTTERSGDSRTRSPWWSINPSKRLYLPNEKQLLRTSLPTERKAIAKNAAKARWASKKLAKWFRIRYHALVVTASQASLSNVTKRDSVEEGGVIKWRDAKNCY